MREKMNDVVEKEEDWVKLQKVETALESLLESKNDRENQAQPAAEEFAKPEPDRSQPQLEASIADMTDSDAQTAAAMVDNQDYVQVVLNGVTYRALFDPGAVITIVGPKVAERFKHRLLEARASIQTVTGELSPVLGYLKISFELDGITSTIKSRAVKEIGYDVVLGKYLCESFKIDTDHKGWWRANGDWRHFNNQNPPQGEQIFSECAGISELNEYERRLIDEMVDRILLEYSPNTLGFTDLTEHHILITENTPVRQKFRRRSPKKIEPIQQGTKKLQQLGIIERSASDFVSQPVLVPEAEGEGERLCVDYTNVNKLTKKDCYPLSQMDAILDRLRSAQYLSKIDLRQAYYQVKMDESSKKYTALAVPGYGLWQFTKMPFGLINALMTLQRLVDALFGPEDAPHVFGY